MMQELAKPLIAGSQLISAGLIPRSLLRERRLLVPSESVIPAWF